jgi:anaerobic sulfite reductase subunit C
MSLDLDVRKIRKNAYRITKVRNKTALRIRVPGGHLDARFLDTVRSIAEEFGDGTVHLTIRQGFEIPGIPFEKMDEVNARLAGIIRGVEIAQGVHIENIDAGYPAAGTRNISACIGNRVCPFANYDTTALAAEIEREIYPNNFHVKVALTGCPNDCIKAHMQDFGIIGQTIPQYEYDRCMGCEACVKNCAKRVTGALTMHKWKVLRDPRRCIGCGECVLRCPTGAWTRSDEKYFRIVIMGRTGKKNPRLAAPFVEWCTREAVVGIIKNVYAYAEKFWDKSLDKEHVGYIVDRTGYPVFRDHILDGVTLNPEARVAQTLVFNGYSYERDFNLTRVSG